MKRFYPAFFRSSFLVLLCVTCFTVLNAQNIYLVDAARTGITTATPVTTVDAAAWSNATGSLQAALNAATSGGGGQIWVKEGTYKPSDYPNGCSNCSGERDKSFLLRNNIALYGSFAGTETQRSQRNFNTNLTILSGDIGTLNVTSDNSYHVLITVNSDSTAVLDGFTITGGSADGSGSITIMGQNSQRNIGPGMLNDSLSSPSVSNCAFSTGGSITNVDRCLPTITNSNFTNSAGISNSSYCNPIIANCNFTSVAGISNTSYCNPVVANCSFISGAGISNTSYCNSNITNCSFINGVGISNNSYYSNAKVSNCSFASGAGIRSEYSNPIITNCTFTNNSSGIYNSFAQATVTNCTFTNSNGMGNDWSSPSVFNCTFVHAGMYNSSYSGPGVTNCIFANNVRGMENVRSSPTVTNCIFVNNTYGMFSSSSSWPSLTNCIFANNNSFGIVTVDFSTLNITNCIIWGNSSNTGSTGINYANSNQQPVVNYSIIQGGYSGTGNLNVDPLFRNAALPAGADSVFGTADDGLQLQPCSPAINNGNNAAVSAGITTDLMGMPRINNGMVDMGAYEYQGLPGFLAVSGNSATATASPGSTIQFKTTNCQSIASLLSTGTNPVNGNITARVWVDTTQANYNSGTYVKRHYEITPVTNAITATARITVYATQPEFNNFNNYASNNHLPTGSADAVGIGRLRIIKFSGQSSNGTGTPSSYTQPGIEINPADSNIVWNNALQRWEITFDVTGFSGFLIGDAGASILPLTLLNFEAKVYTTNSGLLRWRTAHELNTGYFELQRSMDSYHFIAITKVQAKGSAQNATDYNYTDKGLQAGLYYYRLRMVDKDGKEAYSPVVNLQFNAQNTISLYPVPAKEIVWLNGGAASLVGSNALLMDVQGRILQTIRIKQWPQPISISALSPGNYLIKMPNEKMIKFIRQ